VSGNRSKPLQLIKGHRTKEEIEFRRKAEQAMKTGSTLKATDDVKADPVAYKEFKRLKKLYSQMEADFVDGLDTQAVNRYCLLISQEKRLLDEGDFLALHKTREMILKLEDRLFLNPLSRIKAVPKQPPEKKESPMAEFLKRRIGNAT